MNNRLLESDFKHRGTGFCEARSIHKENDYCNEPVIKNGRYCPEHTCIIHKCKEQAMSYFMMMPRTPRFCRKHHTQEYASKYGCEIN